MGALHAPGEARPKPAAQIEITEGAAGLFYATSPAGEARPDLKGLLVAEPTLVGLEEAVPKAIAALAAAQS
jgi:hypothetical protein